MQKKYVVIEAESLEELMSEVDAKLRLGYELVGGFCTEGPYYYQAMLLTSH